KPVKNVDLWQRLDTATERHEVVWHWVKGHADDAENERADELARDGMAPFKKRRPRAAAPAEEPPALQAPKRRRPPASGEAHQPRRRRQEAAGGIECCEARLEVDMEALRAA